MTRRQPGSTRTDNLLPNTTPLRSVLRGGQPGADVEELAYPVLLRQPGDRAAHEVAVVPYVEVAARVGGERRGGGLAVDGVRSEEHTSELQSLMRISYAVFCLTKTNNM